MDQCKYNVVFEDFTKRHFVKSFEKKYGKAVWDKTYGTIVFVCERIQNMLLTKRADLISSRGDFLLVKLDFAVVGTKISPKASGNRCILLVNNAKMEVRVSLVYSKDDISTKKETQEWKNIIFGEYPEIRKIFS